MPDAPIKSRPAVLITGGGQRVGLHCARRLVEDGFQVVISCRRLRAEWQTTPLQGIDVIVADFSTVEGIAEFIAAVAAKRLRLRAIIHNASLWLEDEGLTPEQFQQMCMVHMQAPYMINMAAADWFDSGPADIIHITDHDALGGNADHVAYLATKAGLENMTRSFAARFAPDIKVNSIAPALIMFNDNDSEEFKKHILSRLALGVEPGPEVVYQAVRYVMGNPYITGTCQDLNGGGMLKFA
ncbi:MULTISPECIES: dihydromonapterin reductase [Pseudomonas]|uniref:dihydromonapterin reductase n=1 Tax=Pseudomonas TaxID=286 RepID=UPI00123AFCD0|nr:MULTISPECIES: dihydromonapterin reductase [Pseudomonas]QIB51513.1 dihydromonapterin reductase [Pseudomonas sp. OIL-1]